MFRCFIIFTSLLAAFWPVFSAGFIALDDPAHILTNPVVNAPFPQALHLAFTQSVNKVFLPLTSLSFYLERQIFGLSPFVVHLDNVILHMLTTFTVLILFKRLGVSGLASFFGAMVFAVHPMKVESVAWATERKDVLYALFYVLALISYLRYLNNYQGGFYVLSMTLGTLSLLSKPMAISLPLVLFLIDRYKRRPLDLKSIMDKLPFLFLAASIGWITYAQNMRVAWSDPASSFLIWTWSLAFYIWKFFFPFHVFAYYKLPLPVAITNWPFAASLIFLIILTTILYLWRRRKLFSFSAGFFFVSIFFLLRFDVGVDASIVNDRFMYLPGLGFCLLFGLVFEKLWKYFAGRRIVFVVIWMLLVKTNLQCHVWQDSLSFYDEVIRSYPDAFTGYNNRAMIHYQRGALPQALADYTMAINLKPSFAPNYIGRGTINALLSHYSEALRDFNHALMLAPGLAEGYYNRSIVYSKIGNNERALEDARKAKILGVPMPAGYVEGLELKIKPPSP